MFVCMHCTITAMKLLGARSFLCVCVCVPSNPKYPIVSNGKSFWGYVCALRYLKVVHLICVAVKYGRGRDNFHKIERSGEQWFLVWVQAMALSQWALVINTYINILQYFSRTFTRTYRNVSKSLIENPRRQILPAYFAHYVISFFLWLCHILTRLLPPRITCIYDFRVSEN